MKMRPPLAVLLVLALGAGLLLAPAPAAAQRHDPLTRKEVDDLREAAQLPDARTKLFLGFARARLEASEKLHGDPKLQQPQALLELRRLLDDFTAIVDELDDNLAAFNDGGTDLRAALRAIIESETDFQQRLRKLRQTFSPAVLQQMNLELENATESVDDSAKSSRAMLDRQNQRKGPEQAEKKSH
jgi:hypothetical protein